MTQPEEKIIDKVQKLLRLAEHPSTGEAERDAFLQKANSLMVEYAIEEAQIRATQTMEERRKPVTVRVNLFPAQETDHHERFRTILSEVCRTNRVRAVLHAGSGDVTMVGFNEDVQFSQMLFHTIHFGFMALLYPTWDRNLGYDMNVYRLKEAGTKWKSIAEIATSNGDYTPWPDGGVLIRAYKRACKIMGTTPTPHTQRHEAYRHSFAEAFVNRICLRLEEMRTSNTEAATSSGAELVLRDSQADVDEAFYNLFPGKRPLTEEQQAQQKAELARWQEDYAARQAAREAAEAERVAAMSAKERAAYQREKEREARKEARENDRYWRQQDREASKRYDSQGSRAGRAAAESISLTRTDGVGAARKVGELQ